MTILDRIRCAAAAVTIGLFAVPALAQSEADAFKGKTVTFLVSQDMQTATPLQTTWADFSRCTGIRIVNEVDLGSVDDFHARIDSGDAPDLTVLPQPGAVADLVHREQRVGGHPLVPQSSAVSDSIDRYWNPTWKAYGTVDGTLYGAPWDANSKSLVWYSPKRFKAAGYSVTLCSKVVEAINSRRK